MDKKNKLNLGLIIGVLGMIAGVIFLFQKEWVIGTAGTISSFFVLYLGYEKRKNGQHL